MKEAEVFVYPSYIDNSPNSVCEAQIVGLPVIACNVGGVNSLIIHNVSGILIPSNGVFELVYYLLKMKNDSEFKRDISKGGKEIANIRHNRNVIKTELLQVYKYILEKTCKE